MFSQRRLDDIGSPAQLTVLQRGELFLQMWKLELEKGDPSARDPVALLHLRVLGRHFTLC